MSEKEWDVLNASQLLIRRALLPYSDDGRGGPRKLYDVLCVDGKVHDIRPTEERQDTDYEEFSHSGGTLLEADGLLLPGLCHAHIHLDKCYLLEEYEDLQITKGNLQEALSLTAEAKARFRQDELKVLRRGHQLIRRSVECGVTSMRAFVEVDKTVQFTCVNLGIRLREQFKDQCDVRITGVQAVGSAPYLENNLAAAHRNINWVLDLAWWHGLCADFHLDYNFDPSSEPLIWYLLEQLEERMKRGTWKPEMHVSVGHATRLALFTSEEWTRYKHIVEHNHLPVTLVGLPQSDLYMMGRGAVPAPRSTLNVTRLAKEHGVQVAMAVNNVQNAFMPQGSVDPLSLCPLGIAVYQSGTQADCEVLLKSVTTGAQKAIGLLRPSVSTEQEALELFPHVGDPANFVLLHDNTSAHLAALNPSYDRTTIKDGRIVSIRKTEYIDEDMYRNMQSR